MINNKKDIIIYTVSFIKEIGKTVNDNLEMDIILMLKPEKKYRMTDKIKYSKMLSRSLDLDIPDIKKKINGLLNKLSDKNYDKLKQEIFNYIHLTTDENIIVDLITYSIERIFLLSLSQYKYCNLYVLLINTFINMYENLSNDIIQSLLKNINGKYETLSNVKDVSVNEYDEYCKSVKSKTQLYGLFNFLAHLYNSKIISYNIIQSYIFNLFLEISKNTEYIEEKVECLKNIIITLNVNSYKIFNIKKQFNKIPLKNYKPRIRFMLMDLKEHLEKNI